MAKPRARKGDVVRVRFLDHVEQADEPEEFFVYGRVFKTTKQAYVIDTWCYPDIDNDDRDSDNINRFTILRAVISEVIIYGDPNERSGEGQRTAPSDTGGKDELGKVLG